MKNYEKYKTAKKRNKGFEDFCNKSNHCFECLLRENTACEFRWLELEAEEKKPKPLPCPFCGHEAEISHFLGSYTVICGNMECPVEARTDPYDNADEAIAAWNRRTK